MRSGNEEEDDVISNQDREKLGDFIHIYVMIVKIADNKNCLWIRWKKHLCEVPNKNKNKKNIFLIISLIVNVEYMSNPVKIF